MIATSIVIHGAKEYYAAGSLAVRSLLEFTNFDVVVSTCEEFPLDLPRSSRVSVAKLSKPQESHRAYRFLLKFQALENCLQCSKASTILSFDSDAVVYSPLVSEAIEPTIGGYDFAMTEQTTITNSAMTRKDFLLHYAEHSLKFIAKDLRPPTLEDFRFYNSGVVFLSRKAASEISSWAIDLVSSSGIHQVGDHMIADQDYYQVWVNNLYPNSCKELDWSWNHCKYWDLGFPRPEAKILHFSNFCKGPSENNLDAMRKEREKKELSVVVVSYNSANTLRRCLDSVSQSCNCKIIVVDNFSKDNSVEIAKDAGVDVIELGSNTGFAKAANIGARASETRFVCFLNPDCTVSSVLFSQALETLRREPETAVVPMLEHPNQRLVPGKQKGYTRPKLFVDLFESNFTNKTLGALLRKLPFFESNKQFWPLGTCLFLSRGMFERCQGFDESYFLYMEDVEIGQSLADCGAVIKQIPARVFHDAQKGSAIDGKVRRQYLNDARLRYARKHFGRVFACLLRLLFGGKVG
jgi:GT2 family glycosyltransferase